jgi:hypothetical protein
LSIYFTFINVLCILQLKYPNDQYNKLTWKLCYLLNLVWNIISQCRFIFMWIYFSASSRLLMSSNHVSYTFIISLNSQYLCFILLYTVHSTAVGMVSQTVISILQGIITYSKGDGRSPCFQELLKNSCIHSQFWEVSNWIRFNIISFRKCAATRKFFHSFCVTVQAHSIAYCRCMSCHVMLLVFNDTVSIETI